jgi:hypothetical protein
MTFAIVLLGILVVIVAVIYFILSRFMSRRGSFVVSFVLAICATTGLFLAIEAHPTSQSILVGKQLPKTTRGPQPAGELTTPLDQLEAELTDGAIAADIPQALVEGDARDITVEIARSPVADVNAAIAALNKEYANDVAEPLKTSAQMYVDLVSPDGAFTVQRIAPQSRYQYVPPDGNASWRFHVVADQAGSHVLDVIAGVDAVIMNNPTAVSYHPYERTVNVEVRPGRWYRDFWASYQTVIIGGIITAVIGVIVAVIGGVVKPLWEGRSSQRRKPDDGGLPDT